MRKRTSAFRSISALGILVVTATGCRGAQEHTDSSAAFVETQATINPNELQFTRRKVAVLQAAMREYQTEFGKQPAELRDLEKLDGKWLSYESFDKWSRDGWGREFRLAGRNGNVEISSAGPDGTFDSADDVR